jgi:hypothetical protein
MQPDDSTVMPSVFQLRADAVNRCIKELERENHVVKKITIDENHAVVQIKSSPACKRLLARERAVVNTHRGRYAVMQLKIFGVWVQYLRPLCNYVLPNKTVN